MENEKPKSKVPIWGFAATAGSSLLCPVIVGVLLDVEFGWTPWATFGGLAFGIFSCISILTLAAKRSQ